MAIRCNTTSPPLTVQIELFILQLLKIFFEPCVSSVMKNKILLLVSFLLLLASSCQKCYQCNQYCAYCTPVGNTGVAYKFCATKDVTHTHVDSIYMALQNNGYDCSRLKNEKRVCDYKSKLDGAVDYYLLQDYYCYPTK